MKSAAYYFRLLLCCLAAVALFARLAHADEKLPPAPPQYFNDFANVTQPATRQQLNDKLRQFEADTSSQVVVAIYPTLPDGAEINQYSTHLFQSWHIGQKGKDNGVGLFVFTQSRQMFIVTGYGMEGPLPDATCKSIIENDIKPHFKAGDYDGGLAAGVDAILAATRGEYKGNGHTNGEAAGGATVHGFPVSLIVVVIVLLFVIFAIWRATHHTTYSPYGRQSTSWPGFLFQLLLNVLSNVTINSSGGWSNSGGGGGGGGGGGFSGGGGSTGGGGAGGSW